MPVHQPSKLQPHTRTSLSLGWAATQRLLSKPWTLTISLRCCRGTPVSGSLTTAAASLQLECRQLLCLLHTIADVHGSHGSAMSFFSQ